jgi:hypothetical protein
MSGRAHPRDISPFRHRFRRYELQSPVTGPVGSKMHVTPQLAVKDPESRGGT